jgi:hypothetical protein
MSPDMRVEELEAILRMFSQIGVDAIRLKPKHEKLKGVFTIRPAAYSKLLTRIAEITKDSSLRLPKVTVAKLPRLLEEDPGVNIAPSACWYRDFNPFVLGCNSRIYACCEMKYENNGFDLGEVVPGQDNLWSLLSPRQRAQPIVPGRCFKGCKGYQVNRDLEYLLRGYAAEGAAIFDSPLYATVRDRVLENIPRDALTN